MIKDVVDPARAGGLPSAGRNSHRRRSPCGAGRPRQRLDLRRDAHDALVDGRGRARRGRRASALRGLRRAPCRSEPVREVDGGWVEADDTTPVRRGCTPPGALATSRSTRTLVVGLDGCSWNVLDPLLSSGRLPNLAGCGDRGTRRAREHDPLLHRSRLGLVRDRVLARGPRHLRLHDASRGRYLEPRRGGTCAGPRTTSFWRDQAVGARQPPARPGRVRRSRRRELVADRRRGSPHLPTSVCVSATGTRRVPELSDDVRRRSTSMSTISALEATRFALRARLLRAEEWDHFFVLFSSTDWLGHAATGLFARATREPEPHSYASTSSWTRTSDGCERLRPMRCSPCCRITGSARRHTSSTSTASSASSASRGCCASGRPRSTAAVAGEGGRRRRSGFPSP